MIHLDQVVVGDPIDYAARTPALRAVHGKLRGTVMEVDYKNVQVLVARAPRPGARTGRAWMNLSTLSPVELEPIDIKNWRSAEGLSQKDLAERLHVDVITVSRWERGETQVPPFLRLALQAIKAMRAACAQRIAAQGDTCPCPGSQADPPRA